MRIFRLRGGLLTWSQGGHREERRHFTGLLANVESLPDGRGDAWRLMLRINGEHFDASISATMTEPEIATLIAAIEQSCRDDQVTLSGSGRMAIGDGPPTPLVEPLDLAAHDWVSLSELADRVAHDWQRRKRDRMSQSRKSEHTGRTA
jgi:hypothetical protein